MATFTLQYMLNFFMLPGNNVLIISEETAFSQLHPILKEMRLQSSLDVILRMCAIMCANTMEKSRNLRVQMKIRGYKEHRGETCADVYIEKLYNGLTSHSRILMCGDTLLFYRG